MAGVDGEGVPLTDEQHRRGLERMYLTAPINAFDEPRLRVLDGQATVEIDLSAKYFHAADAVHGSVYFKLLDDAAFFAANSIAHDVLLLTSAFTTYLIRPVTSGTLRAVGTVVHRGRSQCLAEAVLRDDDGREVGRGSGMFVRSNMACADARGYGDVPGE